MYIPGTAGASKRFFGKGSQPLLWIVSRAVRVKHHNWYILEA